MHLTVFGASGGIGTHVVTLAAERGHQVRAVYRSTPPDPPPGRAEALIAQDIFDPAFAATAIRGADAVIAAVGPNFATRHNARTTMTSPPDLHQQVARTLIAAMQDSAESSRLITVSTASMGPADDLMGARPRLLFRFFRTVAVPNLGRVGQDLRAMEGELAAQRARLVRAAPGQADRRPAHRPRAGRGPVHHEEHLPRRRRLVHPRARRGPRPPPPAHACPHHGPRAARRHVAASRAGAGQPTRRAARTRCGCGPPSPPGAARPPPR